MAYVDQDYFMNKYFPSAEIPDEDFIPLAERASDIVDELTMYKVKEKGLDSYSDFVQEQVKKAVCAQIEYMNYGGIETVFGGGDKNGYSIGNTSITQMRSGTNSDSSTQRVSKMTIKTLMPTGLLYRGGLC